jgi:hypothetical protein
MALLTAGCLIGIPKKDSGVRLIAVGDCLQRLAAKCLPSQTIQACSEYLLPFQVGVQVPNATEKVARNVAKWAAEATDDEAILHVDLANAFNSVERDDLLREVPLRTPLLYPYTAACCGNGATLFGDGFTFQSTRGVQQGDVCGPLLFSVAFHHLILQLQSTELRFQHWYLDDGILCGSLSAMN